MKKFTFLFLICLFFQPGYAQDGAYLPLVVEDRTWSVKGYKFTYTDPFGDVVRDIITEHFRIDVTQDSIVDGKIWHPVYTSRDTFFDWDDPQLELIGIILEENRQVFYEGKYQRYFDMPIFDFNLTTGDTILATTDDISQPLFYVVTAVDTIILDDQVARKRVHTGYWNKLYDSEEFEFVPSDIVWVEGIGDLTHGLLPQPGYLQQNPQSLNELLCVTTDSLSHYTNPEHSSCFTEQIVSGLRKVAKLPLRIFPNPVTDRLYLDNFETLSLGQLTITDLLGRLQFQKKIDGASPRLELDVSTWPDGSYLLTYTTSEAQQYRAMIILKIQ